MRRLLASFLFVTATMAGTAHAQETGSMRSSTNSIDIEEGSATGDAARVVYDKFALCIVKRHYMQVRKALAGPPNMAADVEALPRLMDKECFFGSSAVGRVGGTQSIQLTTNPVSFRGQLFKALVIKDFARKPVAFGPTAQNLTGDNSDLLQLTDCIARQDPAVSLTLISATAGTAAEHAAVAALAPAVKQCSAGRRMSISKDILIGFLAEAYFREADAAKSAGAN